MFKYYVLNYNYRTKQVEPFNIFQNWILDEAVQKEVRKYLRSPKKYVHMSWRDCSKVYGFEGFCEELRGLIMWQEWARCEYEISVGKAFAKDNDEWQKIDCYYQCKPNIPMIAREVIYQYKEAKKNEQHNSERTESPTGQC